ncbi:hypothetical protein I7I48_00119 [Histoplasma ohiense]|nr:hypothetical protein I7I48_00119 [Histoplasma ohiense (nom. inval.)]
MKLNPVVYEIFWSIPQISAAEFLIKFTPGSVCEVVFRLPLTTPSYVAFRTAERIPASPITIRRRTIRKAVTLVASVLAESDQMPTTVLRITLKSFLNGRR